MADLFAESKGGAVKHGGRQGFAVGRADEEAERAGSGQLAIGNERILGSVGREARAEVLEVVEAVEQDPGTEALVLADELTGRRDAPPDDGVARLLGPHGHDSGRGVPAPEPFVFGRQCRRGAERRLKLHASRHSGGARPVKGPRAGSAPGYARSY